MIKNFKFLVLMLGLISMTSLSLPAQAETSAQSNIQTYVQTDDEMFELEGEESDLDYYDAEVDQAKETKKNGTSFADIITAIFDGIIIIFFIYCFYYLRHNAITIENHPITYVSSLLSH